MDTTLPPVNNGAAPLPPPPSTNPSSLEVPLSHSGEIIELDLAEMFSPHQSIQDSIDQLDEVVHMLTRERVKPNLWARFIQECWTRGRYATALHYADKGLDGWPLSLLLLHFRIETHSLVSLSALRTYAPAFEQSPLYLLKASYHLSLSRLAPKTRLSTPRTAPLALPKDPHHPESSHAQEVYPGLKREDRRDKVMTKEDYWYRVEKDLDRVQGLQRGNKVERDLRGNDAFRISLPYTHCFLETVLIPFDIDRVLQLLWPWLEVN